MRLPSRYTRFRLPVVVTLVVVISWLHFRLGPDQAVAHVFLQDLYFLPILLTGFWWGPWMGLLVAVVVCLLYLPYVLLVHQLTPALATSSATQMLLFLVVGLLVGWLRRREQRYQGEAQRAENLAAVGRAVASVAHDMKTPLMAIGGFSAQVKRKLPPEDPDAHKLQVVIDQTARLECMVKEMLDFSRPLDLHPQAVELDLLVAETLEVAQPLAAAMGAKLTTDLEQGMPPVETDPGRLQQALINLLTNAAQASPESGEVELRVWRQGDEVVLAVADQGPGVPPKEREAIFTPFFTTKKDGTGLGLAVTNKIAQALGGRVEVGDNHPAGALFKLYLPLSQSKQG
jgi:signal transduction histidine kinase